MHQFALVDCNNFYVSCERLFVPGLQGKPVVVLSNNDGCVIARSDEAKALAIPMGAPYFKYEGLIRRQAVRVFSSNYALYGDLSHRVMTVLQQLEPRVEIYSVDEAFIALPDGPEEDLAGYAAAIKRRVEQCVGLPVSIGVGPTKTLAKVANRFAKKDRSAGGVFVLRDAGKVDALLDSLAVRDIWGIGSRAAEKLQSLGIDSARKLKDGNDAWLRKNLTVTGLRTALELRGISCLALESVPAARKSIVSSRSFGRPVESLVELREALASYVTVAAAKLRGQESVAAALQVFLHTNRFKAHLPQYSPAVTLVLPQPTSFTPALMATALQGLQQIYKPGYQYQKVGVVLTGLGDRQCQQHLFHPRSAGDDRLMAAVDLVNSRWGRNAVQFAGAGLLKPWSMKQAFKSPAYTSNWRELPVVMAV